VKSKRWNGINRVICTVLLFFSGEERSGADEAGGEGDAAQGFRTPEAGETVVDGSPAGQQHEERSRQDCAESHHAEVDRHTVTQLTHWPLYFRRTDVMSSGVLRRLID